MAAPGQHARLELAADWRLAEAFPGLFEHRSDVTQKRLPLDLSGQNQGENDSGLLGIACHPEFAQPDMKLTGAARALDQPLAAGCHYGE